MFRKFEEIARRIGLTMTRCPVCGMVTDKVHGPLCPACALEIQPRTGGYCPQCGTMFGNNDDPPMQCAECRLDPPPWDSIHFHGRYSGRLRELILSYKFNNGFGRTRLLADMACKAFHTADTRIPDIIIPVPLHRKRLLWRGFNQSTELARILGKALHRPVLRNGLIRSRHTMPQTRLGFQERQMNIKDAFVADAKKVKGAVALVVDDVYTTGATLSECARTLKRAGVIGVDVLVLARAQQEPR